MESYVYLVKNQDLYIIGVTKSLDNIQQKLSPGKLVAYMKTSNSEETSKKLHKRYSESRIPQSAYFRLSSSQISDCKQMMKSIGGRNFFQPIFRGRTLLLTVLISWLLLSGVIIKFGIDPIFERFF